MAKGKADPQQQHEDSSQGSSQPGDLLVVGIGASAGGVQALKEFFENVKGNTGIAYVVILHLSPDYDSKLADLLQTVTRIPVKQVTEKTAVAPDHVYVVPPDRHLMISDGQIIVSKNTEVQDRRAPVDIFFRTLATSYGSRAICVVLSGTGANGSMGLKHVKELGGAAFVQNPREAEFNEMPRNSIATDLVDAVLPVAEIPNTIIAYKHSLALAGEKRVGNQQEGLREILAQLRVRTGHDFTNYKRPTLLRRIERRINLRNLPDLNAYSSYLRENPEETAALLKDLLISVTNFFRDHEAFEVLEREVIANIVQGKSSENQVRIWVPGCATGEEAYSIAMMCAELISNVLDAPKIQIFATDIDNAAIAAGREGVYTINDAADVSPERLRRFFNKEGDDYQVRREIREMIVFASHNFMKDPPFSHLDLISCRNVLIYLNGSAQDRVMETFHFALNSGGFLFLGSSESVDGKSDLYAPFNREHHIFQKRQISSSRPYPLPESIPSFQFEKSAKLVDPSLHSARRNERQTFGDLHLRLLEEYAPPSIVVNVQHEVVHLSGRAGRYLVMGGGEPSKNLVELVRPELRLEVRSALYQAVQQDTAVKAMNLRVRIDDLTETINIHVRPVVNVVDPARGFILVLFERIAQESGGEKVVISSAEPIARQLEEELNHLKTQLGASNQQHELHAEELKASNEELQAMNEELRSSAEELETSKEELQSINEELRTVNQELKVKVDETTLANNNLFNLINSVDVGTIFLDRSLRVAFFTPAARDLFNLIPADYGRPLSDITSRLKYKNLLADAETVLVKLQSLEREVRTTDGRVFMMRVSPYRTAEDRINGVVVTFVEITARKKTEEELRSSEERMRSLIESAKDYAIFTFDLDRLINSWNTGAQTMIGYTEQEIIGQSADIIFTAEVRQKGAPTNEQTKARDRGVAENERWHQRKDGSRFYGSGTVRPIHASDGKITGFVKIMRDLTDAKRDEQAKYFLASLVESSEDAIVTIDFNNIITGWNKSAESLYGHPASEAIGRSLATIILPDDIQALLKNLERIRHSQKVELYDTIRVNKEGRQADLEVMLSPIKNASGDIIGVSTIARDITDRKSLERQKDEFIGIASHELKTPVTSIKGYAEILQNQSDKIDHAQATTILGRLLRQVDRLDNLIRDLLDTTKIAEGRLQLRLDKFALDDEISEVLEEFRDVSSARHTLLFEKGDVGIVTADPERIRQVLTNMVANAIKYSPTGGKVAVRSERHNGEIKVSVSDEGIGVPIELQSKLFDRFFRVADDQAEVLAGIGLGLYISAGIIQRHGGSVGVQSAPGKGSTFYFTLPSVTPK